MQLINKLNHIILVDLHHRTAERVQPAPSVHLTRRSVKHHAELTTQHSLTHHASHFVSSSPCSEQFTPVTK